MTPIKYKSNMEAIPFQEFLNRTGFNSNDFGFRNLTGIKHIVSPTDLEKIFMVNAMPMPYLEKLLSKIGTLSDPENKIYAGAKIKLACVDPNSLLLGQKFVYRKNYTAILENFQYLFTGFAMPRGIFKFTPYLIIGQDVNHQDVIAHYLPPIVEIHQDKSILLDGVHRNFIAQRSGNNPETIIIEGVKAPFPCSPKSWRNIKVVDKKPKNLEDRYFDLEVGLFRDLKSIGIDG